MKKLLALLLFAGTAFGQVVNPGGGGGGGGTTCATTTNLLEGNGTAGGCISAGFPGYYNATDDLSIGVNVGQPSNPTFPGGNTLFGSNAGHALTLGRGIVAIGNKALFAYQSNTGTPAIEDGLITAVGTQACASLTTGDGDICVGQNSGFSPTHADSSVFVGTHSADNIGTSDRDTFVGITVSGGGTGGVNTSSDNVMMGFQTGYSSSTSTGTRIQNTLLGTQAGFSLGGTSNNTFVGYRSGYGNSGGSGNITGNQNTTIGALNGGNLTTATQNFFGGYNAGNNVTTGSHNIVLGTTGGPSTGSDNVILGNSNTGGVSTGSSNVMIGSFSGQSTGGSSNSVFIGFASGVTANSGSQTYVGYGTGRNATSGTANTALGYQALGFFTSGSNNTAVGDNALAGLTGAESSDIGIGSGANVTAGVSSAAQIGAGTNATTGTIQYGSQGLCQANGTSCPSFIPAAAFPVAPASYFMLGGLTGTTWPATIGSFTLTKVSGTWGNQGAYYNGTNDTINTGFCNAAGTMMIFYTPDNGAQINANTATSNQYGVLISFDAGSTFIAAFPSYMNQGPAVVSSGTPLILGVDRVSGPVAATLAMGGTPALGLYGNQPVGVWTAGGTSSPTSTGTVYVGDYRTSGNTSFYGTIHAIACWSGNLTAAQQKASFNKIASDLAPYDLTFSDKTDYSHGIVISDGDSIPQGFGTNFAYGGTEMNQAIAQLGLNVNYYNTSHGGFTTANLNSEYVAKNRPILRKHSFQYRIVSDASGTNDIFASTANATIITNMTTFNGNVHADGAKFIIHTVLPATRNSGTQNTNLGLLNPLIVSGVLSGAVADTLSDWASEPTMGNSSNAADTTLYGDGLHPTNLGAGLLANVDALALHRLHDAQTPFWFKVPFVPKSFTGVAATTKTNTLVQLMPGEQVCGIRSNIGTAFSGTSITALTFTVGDSTGSTSQYLSSQSMLGTGSTNNLSPNYSSLNGVVQANFTSTGANLSAISAGALNLYVCLVTNP